MNTFHLPLDSPLPGDTILPSLRALNLPARAPLHALNQIGHRLETLLRPNGRGKLSADLVRRFLGQAAIRLSALGRPWHKLTDAQILAEIGVRKILVAAGHSARFSPGLARKQLALGDGFSTLLLQARQAAGFHCCSDIVVLDAVAAYRFLPEVYDPEVFHKNLLPRFRGMKIPGAIRDLLRPLRTPGVRFFSSDILADIYEQARSRLSKLFPRNPARARAILDGLALDLFRPLVEGARPRVEENSQIRHQFGLDVVLALAKPWGPGEAFLEGLRRLKDLGLARQTRYVMPIYSDYAPALLPHYPPIYLEAYLEAVASPDAAITLGAKSPLDKVEDRGNILLADGPRGPAALAIREWRDMTEAERKDARARLDRSRQSGQPHHGLNAGVFVMDRAWADRQASLLRRAFDHPDPAKGKPHEYWYTDLVEVAARQNRTRKVVFLGEDAPAGCKDVPRLAAFGDAMAHAVRKILIALGVHVDTAARIRLRGLDPSFSLEAAARQIFGDRPDSIFLFGDVFLEDTVRIEAGAVLDGRGQPVQLTGSTHVGPGVHLCGSSAEDSTLAGHPVCAWDWKPLKHGGHATSGILASCIRSSFVAPDVTLRTCNVHRSFVQGDLQGASVSRALVPPGETPVHASRRRQESSSQLLAWERDYLPGAFRIMELSPADARGVMEFIQQEMDKLFREKISDAVELRRAREMTLRLIERNDVISWQTPESLYRHAFGWVRTARLARFEHSDAFRQEKISELKALSPVADAHLERLVLHDFSDIPPTRKLFRELTLLAVQANLFDWQSPAARPLLQSLMRRLASPKGPARSLDFSGLVARSLALDGYAAYESLVFDAPPAGDFLYLTDNTGEALFDALVWFALCEMGHRVTVAAKEFPAGGDATVEDVLQVIRERPALLAHFQRRTLRVISNGNDTYGTFLDRVPEEFRVCYFNSRALIGKGQANLYTTAARNALKAPYVAQFLIKGMTAQRLAGTSALRRDGRKIPRLGIAVIPAGQCVTEVAPGRPGCRTLKQVSEGRGWNRQ